MAGRLGFSVIKIERRRPSKRETTSRAFAIVRNWESNAGNPSTADITLQTPEKVISNQDVEPSPQYSRQSWHSTERTSITEINEESLIQHEHTIEHGYKPESPKLSSIHDTRTESHGLSIPGSLPSFQCAEVERATSIVVDHTPTPHGVPPHNDSMKEYTPDVTHQKHNVRGRVTRQKHSDEEQPTRKTRGRKRKQDVVTGCDEESQDKELDTGANRFVRIFNADQGRKVSVTEITDLDVALTAIEEEALEYRGEVESEIEKQCIKEYFIHIRKSFGECIDMQKEYRGMKSDLRKAKSQLNKYKSELLEVQKKRTRLKGRLEKLKKEHKDKNENDKDLVAINNFVHQMKSIQKKCPVRTPDKTETQDCSSFNNLPSLMCQMQALLVSMTRLRSINTDFEGWLNSN